MDFDVFNGGIHFFFALIDEHLKESAAHRLALQIEKGKPSTEQGQIHIELLGPWSTQPNVDDMQVRCNRENYAAYKLT